MPIAQNFGKPLVFFGERSFPNMSERQLIKKY